MEERDKRRAHELLAAQAEETLSEKGDDNDVHMSEARNDDKICM